MQVDLVVDGQWMLEAQRGINSIREEDELVLAIERVGKQANGASDYIGQGLHVIEGTPAIGGISDEVVLGIAHLFNVELLVLTSRYFVNYTIIKISLF